MELEILLTQLSKYVKWNHARLCFLANFLLAMIRTRTSNLSEIAGGFSGKTQKASNYRRIQRFFQSFSIDFTWIAKLIAEIIKVPQPWDIVLDRTNWDFGRIHINILVLGIAYKGIAIPIFWTILSKKGNSNLSERQELFDSFFRAFPNVKIRYLLADREFVSYDWFDFLSKKHISFRIRIHKNFLISNSRGIPVAAERLFLHIKVGQCFPLDSMRVVLGHYLFVVGVRLPNELLIIVTNQKPDSARVDYSTRWQIESFFACCKTHGFRLEESHLTTHLRIKKLFALLSIAFVWAHISGEFFHTQKNIPIKSHGRKSNSFFRYGFEHLRFLIFNISSQFQQFSFFVSLLSLSSPYLYCS